VAATPAEDPAGGGVDGDVPENAKGITGLGDLCGKTIAVLQGSLELTDAQTQNKKCTQTGKPAVKVQAFPDQSSANQLVGAMNELIAKGTYSKILAKWGQQKAAVTKSVVKPRTEQG
jgi:ABC-type amino acid transport substrate-binding protein